MKSRNNNQVRVVAPEQDARLRLLAEACIRFGLPDSLADILAEGYVARLRRRVYQSLNDEIGSGDDVEALCGWGGPPRVLAKALQRGQYVREINGVYVMTDAVNEAPEYLKKRWKRCDKAGYVAAVKRSARPNVVHQYSPYDGGDGPELLIQPEEDHMQRGQGEGSTEACPQETLFGYEPEQQGEVHVASDTGGHKQIGHRQIVQYWHQRYIERENPSGYPWRKSDFKYIQWILQAIGDIHRVKRILDAYLANRSAFYRGHELRKLYNNLAEFARPGNRAHAHAHAGTDAAGRSSDLGSQASTEAGRL